MQTAPRLSILPVERPRVHAKRRLSSAVVPSQPADNSSLLRLDSRLMVAPAPNDSIENRRRSFIASKDKSSERHVVGSSKNVPNYLGGATLQNRAYDSAMRPFTLRFTNVQLEDVFRKHYRHYVRGKVQMGCFVSVMLHVIMGLLEFVFEYGHPHEETLVIARCCIVAVILIFYRITKRIDFHLHFEAWMVGFYLFHGALVVGTSVLFESVCSSPSDHIDTKDGRHEDAYLFYAGRWSQAISLIFLSILFNASGMMFIFATFCAWVHVFLMIIVPFALYPGKPELVDPQIAYGPILTCFCMLSAYNSEKHIRREFVLRCNVADDRKRRDDLLETMLPVHIKESLKANRTNDLADQFDEVSILFCYVSDFGRLSKSTSAIELVQLMNRIVFCFDKATDSRGVYKVEAIAETYMCAAGVPICDPFHHEKIADMALTMMCIQEQEQWTCNNERIRLQIGIHSGPVVGGVIGSKTYSYHLFGDTVNTSSRVCSSSMPGRIQISERTSQLLARSGCYDVTPRGKVALKGKGELMLYWLEKKIGQPQRNILRLSTRFDLAEEVSIATQPSVGDGRAKVDDDKVALVMNKRTLQFEPSQGSAMLEKVSYRMQQRMETAFVVDYNMANLAQWRTAVKAAIAVLVVATIGTSQSSSSEKWITVALNSVCVALLGLLYMYSFRKKFRSHMQPIAGVVVGAVIITLNFNLVLSPGSNILNLNIVYVVLVSLLLRFRFVTSVAINTATLTTYFVFLLASYHALSNIVGYLCITLFCAAIGEYSCYRREAGLRADFLLKHALNVEKKKCEELLANMLPSAQYAEAMLLHGTIVDELNDVTLLYSDMVGFTALSATLKPVESCLLLNKLYSAFDRHLDSFGVYKMDTVGDAFIVIGGLPNYTSEKNHAIAITAFAVEMLREMEAFRRREHVQLQMRIGIHTGKVIGGVVGIKKPRYLIWGSHTVIANSMEAKSIPGHIQISDSTYRILRASGEYVCEPAGNSALGDTYFIQTDTAPTKAEIMTQYFPKAVREKTRTEPELEQFFQAARKDNPFFQNVQLISDASRILHKISAKPPPGL
ncbi:Nitrogen permease regulator 2 [Aphanomyces cochlioides]|nr:Nitrogen permease regulator 2 [Aphanomyces cochlioides]